ncbi:MAG: transglycosylase SLT domain-containing protein [Pseudomonadota bacterium]
MPVTRVILAVFLSWFGTGLWADAAALSRALEARTLGDWARAVAEARAAGPLGQDIIEWHRLRAKQGTFDEARAFLARRSDWPGLPYLRQRSEHAIGPTAPAVDVINFFVPQPPRTGNGALRYAAALRSMGQRTEADKEILLGWTTLSLSTAEEAEFITEYGALIRPQHWARTDMLLWRGLTGEAKRMLPLLSADRRALAEARIALRDGEDGVNAKINAVPNALAGDPGLAFERFLWRVNRGRSESAIELLETQTELGDPEAWGNLRRRYARQLMRAGEDRRAYRLASRHGLREGRHYADLEWLSGFIALRKLGDADTAIKHFERMEKAVDTPISLSRGQYWQGRAHAAMGNTEWAREDFARAAQHQTAFYGLLAAEEIGADMDPKLAGTESFPPWRGAAFTQSSVYEAARLLLEAGDLSLGERFLTHLAESLDRTQVAQMAAMALEMGEPHLEVMIAKRGVQYGMVLERPYFALHPLAADTGDVDPALALAIARRESEFDPRVMSGVGAMGLMQLMPATAEEMAGDIGLPFIPGRLLDDPDYNARLGLTYLAELEATFGDSPVLISAAYNAGPSRAFSWMERNGDPRSSQVDVVDWIEHVPFRETRNYIMRVVESLPVYRARLSGSVGPIGISDDLRGERPTGAVIRGPKRADWAPTQSLRPQRRPASLSRE